MTQKTLSQESNLCVEQFSLAGDYLASFVLCDKPFPRSPGFKLSRELDWDASDMLQ